MIVKKTSKKNNSLAFSIYHNHFVIFLLFWNKFVLQTRSSVVSSKGQLISKCLFGVFNSPKKRMKTIRLEVP